MYVYTCCVSLHPWWIKQPVQWTWKGVVTPGGLGICREVSADRNWVDRPWNRKAELECVSRLERFTSGSECLGVEFHQPLGAIWWQNLLETAWQLHGWRMVSPDLPSFGLSVCSRVVSGSSHRMLCFGACCPVLAGFSRCEWAGVQGLGRTVWMAQFLPSNQIQWGWMKWSLNFCWNRGTLWFEVIKSRVLH